MCQTFNLKSILSVLSLSHSLARFPQISDWLNLDQNMAKNYHVDVGDIEAISEAINKQKVKNP